VSGRVALALPPPFGSLTLADWGGPATEVERDGSYDYDLPSIVPAGVVLNCSPRTTRPGSGTAPRAWA
jgi:hypothetical protein